MDKELSINEFNKLLCDSSFKPSESDVERLKERVNRKYDKLIKKHTSNKKIGLQYVKSVSNCLYRCESFSK